MISNARVRKRQANAKLLVTGGYVVVQFYPWFNFYFPLYSLSYIAIHKNKGK